MAKSGSNARIYMCVGHMPQTSQTNLLLDTADATIRCEWNVILLEKPFMTGRSLVLLF